MGVLCKRYRMLNKIIAHITKPFKTFRSEEPSNEMLQKILSYRWEAVKKEEASKAFDEIWEPSEKDNPSVDMPDMDSEPVKIDMSKEPVIRIMLVGHWAQVMKDTSMKPFWTMSQMSTLDGSPKLERQVQKFSLQASQKTARMSAAGYFYLTRSTI